MSEKWTAVVPDNIESDFEVEKIERNESFYVVCKGVGYSNQQIVEIYEAIERVGCAVKELMKAVEKVIRPALELISEWYENVLELYYSSPEKKRIYKAECRLKSNVKNYGYTQNYRKRMFCVGGYGNFRRF